MSFDDYAQQLIQKYRLAVTIGIIQSKPEAKSLDQHIADLRNKIYDGQMDDMSIRSDDFDMELTNVADLDEQLDTSQHSVTILKDFNDVHLTVDDEIGLTDIISSNAVDLIEDNGANKIQNDEIQSRFCETQAQFDAYIARESLTDIDKTFCDSIALVNRNELITIDEACVDITNPDNTQVSTNKMCKYVQKNHTIGTDNTHCDSLEIINKNNKNIAANFNNTFPDDKTNTSQHNIKPKAKESTNIVGIDKQYLNQTTAFDSQATELYTLHTLTEDYTHVSQSQTNNLDIPNKYVKGISKNKENQDMRNSIEYKLPLHVISTQFGNNVKDAYLVEKVNNKLSKVSNTMQGEIRNFSQNSQLYKGISDNKIVKADIEDNTEYGNNIKDINLVKKINKKLEKDNITRITDDVELTTVTEIDVNNSRTIADDKAHEQNVEEHATSTEFEYIFKDINLARKISSNLNKDNIAMDLDVINFDVMTKAGLNTRNLHEDYTEETRVLFGNENSQRTPSNSFGINITENIDTVYEMSRNSKENMTMQVFNYSQTDQDNLVTNGNDEIAINTEVISITNFPTVENMTMQVFNFKDNVRPVENNTSNAALESSQANVQNTETMQAFDFSQEIQRPEYKISENDIENESVSSEEISELVPFKVMEELNRVKAFLNRNIERRASIDSSLDSGYRSDSQGRSKSAFQLSGNWIGQSAYCLYEHLTRCPMVATTQEIVEDISQVLGQLIDRLHEEECYPTFLEQLLNHVDTLIRSIFMEEDMLLEKDEKIQRLFLLNKSNHIQKYSIEKLTDVLENIHTNLTSKEELHELTNIGEIENLSYIFHTLEVIIKRHIKAKKIDCSQSQSQETENPKRSSISDIWRKKWNPNYKEEIKLEGSLDKKCVLAKCSEVLNKIVVGCLDGYSLVAYAALQCFNLLQS